MKTAFEKEYKAKLTEEHPIINACPAAAITHNVGLKGDIAKELGKNPIEYHKPKYYNDLHPRTSYSYDEQLTKVKIGDNPNVFRIDLTRIGEVKVRGWNKKLRFDDEKTDFLTWAKTHRQERIGVVVSRDKVGDYFIVFKIKKCLKPFAEPSEKKVGIDVGISDIAVCSDGTVFENKKFKKDEKRHQRLINRKMSRRWGPSNEVYREALKRNKAERKKIMNDPELNGKVEPPPPLKPSKGYLREKQRHAKLNRKISRKRDAWNHEISRRIVEENGLIAVETLNITGMLRNRHLSYALSDAAFGTLLLYIKYKSDWHNRTIQSIDRWTPSSKRCSECGYTYNSDDEYRLKPWSLSIRTWKCPVCGTVHDRDINAAKNILFFAEQSL